MFHTLKRTAVKWYEDRAPQMGAALAYYTLFSIAPLLLIAIAIAGVFYGEDVARSQVMDDVRTSVDAESAKAIDELLEGVRAPGAGLWATAIGGSILLFAALGMLIQLKSALGVIWKLEPPQGRKGFLLFLFDYLFALVMVVGCGLLVMASLAASTTVMVLTDVLGERMPGGTRLWQLLDLGVSFALITLLFAMTFRYLSNRELAWRQVWLGAIVSSLLYTAGKWAIGFYLAFNSTSSMYGAAGSLVVFLIWIYYSAQILFFGAELIAVRREAAARAAGA